MATEVTAKREFTMGEQLEVGRCGDDIFLAWCKSGIESGKFQKVIDLRNDKAAQKDGVDFAVVGKNGRTHTYMVKTDTRTTGNIFLETSVDSVYFQPGRPAKTRHADGWLLRTKATFIFYVFLNAQEIYIFCPSQAHYLTLELCLPDSRVPHPTIWSARNRSEDGGDSNEKWYGFGPCVRASQLVEHPIMKGFSWKYIYTDYKSETNTARFIKGELEVPF